MRLKQLGERTYCMENEPCRRSSVYKDNLIGGSLWGLDGRPLVNTLWHRLRSLSAAQLENRAFLETWSCSKRAPSLNIWPSLNIEPTFSQISEETLESLKLRERNSRASNSTQSQTTRRASPEWHHATRTRGIPSSHRSFQLKSKYQTTSKVAESCGIYL